MTSNRFRDCLGEILERAQAAAVSRMVSIACDLDDSRETIALARNHRGITPTVGIHPCYVHQVGESDWRESLRQLASSNPAGAIGEIGLDYYHAPPEGFTIKGWRDLQRAYFGGQLELARELDLPAVIHQRESGDDVLDMLRDFPGVRAVLHCFTGTIKQAETALAMGHYLSFTGVVTYPKAQEVREVVAMVPANRLMVETDSPYLAPVPHRGRSNEPSYLVHTAAAIAEIRNLTFEECAEQTSANARAFFKHLSGD